jgi:hypothetical protein
MRYKDLLIETGLDLLQLRKHGGQYFDKLIQKIQNGERFEVESNYANKFIDGVIIDPSQVNKLLNAYYPDGDKDNMETDAGNNVKVVDSSIFKQPLKLLNSNQTIPFGALTKNKDFKSGSGMNMGIMAEGVLGAALTAKFAKKGEVINIIDVGKILFKMTPEPIGDKSSAVMGTYEDVVHYDSGKEDSIKFILKLSKNEFSPLVMAIKSKEALDSKVKSLINSAMMYVNSESEGISSAINTVINNSKNNVIEITSDGISDNKGTKADLKVQINGEVIKLISLKAMGVKQFGQISGHKFENFQKFVSDLFDIDISKHAEKFTKESGVEAAQKNHEIITNIYKNDIGPEIKEQLTKGPQTEAKFIEKLVKGIIKHAVGDSEVELVKFDRAIAGGYKILKIDNTLLETVKNIKFTVEVQPDRAILKIFGKPTNEELIDKFDSDEPILMLQLRSILQLKAGYVRNILEMGDLLEDLTTVESVKAPLAISKKALQKMKDASVGKITKSGEKDVRDTNISDNIALGRAKKK